MGIFMEEKFSEYMVFLILTHVNIYLIFHCVCVHVHVSVGMYVCAPEYRFPWRLRDEVFLVLEVLAVVSCLI